MAELEETLNRSLSITVPSKKETQEQRNPFEIGRFILLPNRKLAGFLIKTKSERGTIRKILNISAKHNARLRYIANYVSTSEKAKIALIFVDITDCTAPTERIASEIRQSRKVLDIKTIASNTEGFITDTISNPLSACGDRAVILTHAGYKGLIKNIRERFGSAGEAFLYYTGFEIGIEYAESHRKIGQILGITDPAQIFKDITVSLFKSAGFGHTHALKLTSEPPYMLGRIVNSFECELEHGVTKPYSHFIRGMAAGVLTKLLGTKMKVEETKCMAKGDPYCEFEAKPET